jgi:hypothetical protein
MLERSRYLVISELATVCRKTECVVEPMVDDALRKSCTKHTRTSTTGKLSSKPSSVVVAH